MSAGAAPAMRAEPATGGMFRSLRLPNYRVWFFGALISNIGQWMESTALSWVVLTRLTDNNAGAMGIAMALQFGPPLFLFSLTGWVADRVDRRKFLFMTQAGLALISTTVGVLILTDVMTLPLMYVFNLLVGCFNAFDNPARQTFVSDVVPREGASNAVALNSASFNVARLIGPAVAGLAVIAIGPGWVFIANATSFIAMLVALALIRPAALVPRPKVVSTMKFADGFRYLRGRPDFITLFVMVFLLGAFGMNFPIFASTMTLEFGGNADGYGLLSSLMGIGALAGALMSARRRKATMQWVVIASLVFAVATTFSAFAPTYWFYAVCCVVTGFAVVTTLTTANGYIQTTSAPEIRGRVLAMYLALTMGGTFIGAPIVGWVAQVWGPRAAIAVGAAAAFISFGIGITTWALRRRQIIEAETGAIPVVQAMADEARLPTGTAPIDE